MQLLVKATENNADIVEIGGEIQMPPVKAFINDINILSSKESTIRKIVSLMVKQIVWYSTEFKAQKFRSLSLNKRKVNQYMNFKVGDQRISTVSRRNREKLGMLACWVFERY